MINTQKWSTGNLPEPELILKKANTMNSCDKDDYCRSQVSIEISQTFPHDLPEETSIDAPNRGDETLNFREKSKKEDEAYYDVHDNHSVAMASRKLVVEALKDGTIILLICCASLSLLIDAQTSGPEEVFYDGIIIFLSIFFVATFANIFRFVGNRYQMLIKRSPFGSLMRSSNRGKQSKFEKGVHRTSSRLETLWLSLSLIVLIVQAVRCFLCKYSMCDENDYNPDPKGVKNTVEEIMDEVTKIAAKKQGGRSGNGFVSVLCVLIFAARDGFPLGLFVLLLSASYKMKSIGDAMVQQLSACAKIGLVNTICLTGNDDFLTLNHAKMGELWVGLNLIKSASDDLSIHVLEKLQVGVFMNSSGSEMDDSLLLWASKAIPYTIPNGLSVDDHVEKDRSLLVFQGIEDGKQIVEIHWKGELERVISQCSHFYDADGTMQSLDEGKRAKFVEDDTATRSYLQCFAFAYKKMELELEGEEDIEKALVKFNVDDHDHGFILIGLVFLKNPYPPEFKQAVQECLDLGVNLKLMVDDDPKTARVMAVGSGILNTEKGGSELVIINGADFRDHSEETRLKIIDEIPVIANAAPEDKLLMVQCLKKKGDDEVAFIGSSIGELPSLIEADVGIFLGGCNININNVPEMAKENADVILTQPTNMGEIVKVMRFGRYVCQSVSLFLKLHMILNFSAVLLNLISEVWKSEALLSSAQLLWTNLVVEGLGAFAVAMMLEVEIVEPSTSNHQHPVIITKKMWRNVVIQTLSQVTILIVLEMKGKDMVRVDENGLKSMIFNSYIFCQAFVLIGFGAMKKKSRGLSSLFCCSTENLLFLTVVGMILTLQIVMIEIMGVVGQWGSLDLKRWSICIGIAGLSELLQVVVCNLVDLLVHACKTIKQRGF